MHLGFPKWKDSLMTSEQTGADIQVYMFSDLLEGLTVMLIIW
jgi:hypothetical protein